MIIYRNTSSKCYYFMLDQTIRCIQAIEKRDRFSNTLSDF